MQPGSSALVSVIIPAYNYARFLPDTVASIQAQTYRNWECIIVDDESTDDTKNIVARLIEKDKRIQYFFQKNSGPTVARNFGLIKAKGEFIQFLDADDLLEPAKFEVQLGLFKKNQELDLVYGNVKYFRSGNVAVQFDNITLEGSKPWMKKLSGNGDKMILAFLRENLMVIQAPLFKASLVSRFGKMDEELLYNEDWELWTRFAIGNANFLFDETPGTNSLVRVHDSYSTDNFKMYVHGLKACFKMEKILDDRKYKNILVPKIAYHKRIIDENLVATLKTNRYEAAAKAAVVENLTGDKRYLTYSRLFLKFPVWFWYLYSKFLAVVHKLKNTILYA